MFTSVLPPAAAQAPQPVSTFTLPEAFGVTHPTQIIDFDFVGSVDRTNSYLLGPDGVEVPYQVLSNGKIAVQTNLPANTQKVFKLFRGRAAGKFANMVRLDIKPTYYEITNGITGVRIVRPEGANDTRLAPIQGFQLRDGSWTATGPNYIRQPAYSLYPIMRPPLSAKTASATIVDQGPLEVTITVTYTYDNPDFGNPGQVHFPAGPGQYQSTITLQAGQPSITILDDSTTDLQYYLNFYPAVQQNQARWRGQNASSLETGRDVLTGGPYGGGLNGTPSDALRDLPLTMPYYPFWVSGVQNQTVSFYGFKVMNAWNPWTWDTGWYWMLYNAAAGSSAPMVGMYATRASTALGAGCSGATPYGEPNDGTGAQSGGVGFQINRWCGTPDNSFPHVRAFWGLYVGTKGADLGDPYTVQNIHRQMNLQGGINLNKAYRYNGNFPDPVGGYQPMYMDNAGITQFIQKIQTDSSYYTSLVNSDPTIQPLLDMWKDTTGATGQQVDNDMVTFAQSLLDTLVNKSGVYDFFDQYWMGGTQMMRRAILINELLRTNQVTGAQRVQLKAILSFFTNLLWDNDFVPLQPNSGMPLGTENMPVQETQFRNTFALLAPQLPVIVPQLPLISSSVSSLVNYQIDNTGAHFGAPHYMGASMGPTLPIALQMKATGIVNPFITEPKLTKFAQFYMDMMTPPEPRYGGLRKLVSFGDSPTEGSEMYGELATGFNNVNSSLSNRLMQAWVENGRPQNSFYGSTVPIINGQLPTSPLNLSSAAYPGYAAILRHNFGTPNETAAWLIDGEFYSDHRHADRGLLHLYALGAPLSLDWGSQYNPHIAGTYHHNAVVPENAIGAAWSADNISFDAGSNAWASGSQVAFEHFDLSSRATATFLSSDGAINWTRTVRTIAPTASYPVIAISDSFSGSNAGVGKVFSLNLVAQGAVQSTAGTINPVQRTYSAYGSPQELPSTSTPLSLAVGQNHFSFVGQWLIDWDLYQVSNEQQQVVIGNFGHNWAPTGESNQFQAANGRPFEERQDIFRVRGNGAFNVLILPYRKGTQRTGVSVNTSNGMTTISAPGEQTLISDTYYAFQNSQTTALTTTGSTSASAFGITISGGPAEVVVTAGKAVITAHGAAGTRTIQLPGSWQPQAPLTLQSGVFSLNYSGGDPVRIELGP